MKYLLYLTIAGASCWILSEILEIAVGGYSPLILLLTAAFHLLIALGIWGVHAGQSLEKTTLSPIAATITSIGYLLMTYPPLVVSLSTTADIMTFMESHSAFKIAGMAAVLGTMLFGISVLRLKYYPTWTGIALIVCPPIMAAVLLRQGPMIVANVVIVVQSVAWVLMSRRAIRQPV